MTGKTSHFPLPAVPYPGRVSPEAGTDRDPQTGQARRDRTLTEGDASQLSDGGAKSSSHTGDDARH